MESFPWSPWSSVLPAGMFWYAGMFCGVPLVTNVHSYWLRDLNIIVILTPGWDRVYRLYSPGLLPYNTSSSQFRLTVAM